MFVALRRSASGRSVHLAAHKAVLPWLFPVALAIAGGTAGTKSLAAAQVGHEHHDSTARATPPPADTTRQAPSMSPRDTMQMAGMQGMPERPFGIPMTRIGSGSA